MLSIYKYIIAFCLPMNGRDLFKKKIDIQITCYENILNCRLSWREREHTFYKLSDLYYYKYILDNVRDERADIILPNDAFSTGILKLENMSNYTENLKNI